MHDIPPRDLGVGDRLAAFRDGEARVANGFRARRVGSVDGAWWPRSLDPDREIPALVRALTPRIGHITRLTFGLGAWESAPAKVTAGSRAVRVGWFTTLDPHVVAVTTLDSDRRVLLVIPPDAAAGPAAAAMASSTEESNLDRPGEMLRASGVGRPSR